jgi:hypothetical protein
VCFELFDLNDEKRLYTSWVWDSLLVKVWESDCIPSGCTFTGGIEDEKATVYLLAVFSVYCLFALGTLSTV